MRERTETDHEQENTRPNGAPERPKSEAACSAAPPHLETELRFRAGLAAGEVLNLAQKKDAALFKVGLGEIILRELQAVYDRAVHETRPQWQSIDTAPKDGTPILIAFRGIGVHRVFWSEAPFSKGIGAWCVTDCKYEDMPLRRYVEADVLGWMPLPAPPVSDAERATLNDVVSGQSAQSSESAIRAAVSPEREP